MTQNEVVIWSGIIGASIALIGVGLQNFVQSWLQRKQLRHDEQQRRTEREMTLRRDIYMEVAEATAKMKEYLISFSNLEIPEPQRQAILQGSTAATHRVQIIGTIETLRSLGAALDYYGNKVLDLTEKRLVIQLLIIEDSYIQKDIDWLYSRRGELFQELTAIIGQPTGQMRFDQIMQQLQSIEGDLKAKNRSLEDIRQERLDKQLELTKEALAISEEFSNLLVETLLQVRRELKLEIDEKSYREIALSDGVQLQERLEQFNRKLKAEYSKRLEGSHNSGE